MTAFVRHSDQRGPASGLGLARPPRRLGPDSDGGASIWESACECEDYDIGEELLAKLNGKPFRKRPESRASLFRTLDRPALRALPAERCEQGEWVLARVHPDCHVQVRKHFYSVPCRLVQERVDVRATLDGLEVFHRGQRLERPLDQPPDAPPRRKRRQQLVGTVPARTARRTRPQRFERLPSAFAIFL